MSQKTVYECDICGGPGRGGYIIEVEDFQGTAIHPYKYKDVCKECSAKIAEFILSIKKDTNGK